MKHAAKQLGGRIVGTRAIGAALRRLAAARGRSLVLVYHRIAAGEPQAHTVVPCVPVARFRRQIEALVEVGEVVSLERLLEPADRSAPVRFALTFDDDYRSHVEHALPTLLELGVPATFFLSGRALHGRGRYWWEVLEDRVVEHGVEATASALNLSSWEPLDLALACEQDPSRQALLDTDDGAAPGHLDADALERLAHPSMTIGFHTLHHPVLTRLSDAELPAALTGGRDRLARQVGRRLDLFAYPHGKADPRVAAATRRAGYRAAFTGRAEPLRRLDDPFLLGRWEAGPVDVDTLLVRASWRLHRRARERGV